MTLSKRARETVFELAGGLGNQLFQYTAGLYYGMATGNAVAFDTSVIDRKSNHQGKITESFVLPGKFINLDEKSSSARRILTKVASHVTKRFPTFSELLGIQRSAYFSRVVGHDKDILNVPAGSFVRGYFQTYLYLVELRDRQVWPGLTLRNPSNWYLEQAKRLSNGSAHAVHLRRGDYVSVGQAYGLLSASYYSSVLAQLPNDSRGSDWLLFSDDLKEAEKLKIACEGLCDAEVISPPEGSDPAESLMLLSLCSTKIIANSTFSFWAGAAGLDSAIVVAPLPWYRSLSDPEDLIPVNWLRFNSYWL